MVARGTTKIDGLDDNITTDMLQAAAKAAGLRVGLGRFRPSKGGTNGRFVIETLVEVDE